MPHYLPPPPPGGAQWSRPDDWPRYLCMTPPLEHAARGKWTRDPAAVTCLVCRSHPKFPKLPPRLHAFTCSECGDAVSVPRTPGRRRVTCSAKCYGRRKRRLERAARAVGGPGRPGVAA